jgi:hypothetical protein
MGSSQFGRDQRGPPHQHSRRLRNWGQLNPTKAATEKKGEAIIGMIEGKVATITEIRTR